MDWQLAREAIERATALLLDIVGGEAGPILAPTKEMLDEYKKKKGDWQPYEKKFLDLMKERQIEKKVDRAALEDSCLLCSEDKPHLCHRRLVAEYLNEKWGDVQIEHL